MPSAPAPKLVAGSAGEIAGRYVLGDEARALLREGLAPQEFCTLLAQNGQHADAVRFWAHALPKRQAVWWGCLCMDAAPGPPATAPVTAALDAARAWVREPDDARRRASYQAGTAAGLDQPPALVAIAVFFTGGSVAPPDLPEVAPVDHATGDMIGAALNLAAVRVQPEKAPQTLERFLAIGRDIAQGRHLWTEAK